MLKTILIIVCIIVITILFTNFVHSSLSIAISKQNTVKSIWEISANRCVPGTLMIVSRRRLY